MGENTKIEWADKTFNPWEGCQKVGPGCDHCYAEARNERFGGGTAPNWGPGAPRRRTSASNWRKPLKWQAEAKRTGVRPRVFCASLADVFDNAVDPQWRRDLAALIVACPDLEWLLLTKRIGNALDMLIDMFPDGVPENVRIGATVVNQDEINRDMSKIAGIAVATHLKPFLSIEPMLGRIIFADANPRWHRFIGQVICGGESGPGARAIMLPHVQSLRDQCAEVSVPFFFKQWGEWIPAGQEPAFNARILEFGYDHDANHRYHRIGKKAAGRLLDGVKHDGQPV